MIDVIKYIQSGVIVEYILGNLSDMESDEVERLAAIHPEIAAEIEEISSSLSIYDKLGAVAPPSYMQERVWDAVKLSPISLVNPMIVNANNHSSKNGSNGTKYFAVAIFCLVSFLTVSWGYSANNKLKDIETKIVSLKTDNDDINGKLIALKKLINKNNSIYRLPNIKVVVLEGNHSKSPNSLALLVWDKDQKDVYLDIKKLTENNNQDNDYNLWSISQVGLQQLIGTFDYNGQNEITKIGKSYEGVQFQLSLENDKDVKRPTLADIYMKGNVR